MFFRHFDIYNDSMKNTVNTHPKSHCLTLLRLVQKSKILLSFLMLGFCAHLQSQSYSEDFVGIQNLIYKDWIFKNQSSNLGLTSWLQGDGKVFSAYDGGQKDYLAANYNSVSAFGAANVLSNWVMTPTRTFNNGDTFSFYSKKNPSNVADRLEVRFSGNGASTETGVLSSDVGDFSTLLLSINPALNKTDYPTVWTLYTIKITGLDRPTSGRIAFRYHVSNAGLEGVNADYIGIDLVKYTPSATLETQDIQRKNEIKLYPNPVKDFLSIDSPEVITKIIVFSVDGKKIMEQNGLKDSKIDLEFLNKGLYFINVQTKSTTKTIKFIKE